MTHLNDILLFLAGGLLGCLAAWFVTRSRMIAKSSQALAQDGAEIARLQESIHGKEKGLHEKSARISHLQEALDRTEKNLRATSEERSAAHAKLEQMNQIQQTLEKSTDEVRNLTATILNLRERQAELEAVLEKERAATEEKLQLLQEAETRLSNAFQAVSAKALRNSQESFIELARATFAKDQEAAKRDLKDHQKDVAHIIEPIKTSLEKYDQQVQNMERAREKAYGGLSQQVQSLMTTQQQLHKETANLVKALRTPQVRGRWGEITLRRVAELAGMLNYCDFFEQETRTSEQGRLRPDMIVRLPNGKQIVVDSKAPLLAYLEALEAQTEEERANKLVLHSKQIQVHMNQLSQKSYWEQFQPTPEFVVLFIPGENFFSSALEQNPGLIEEGVSKGVILATPTTLISLLKAVSFGWRQETMAENAEVISRLGNELYQRIGTMADHLEKLGRHIEKCVATYNQAMGSLERRVLVSARKFSDLGMKKKGGEEIPYVTPVEKTTRHISLVQSDDDTPSANKGNGKFDGTCPT